MDAPETQGEQARAAQTQNSDAELATDAAHPKSVGSDLHSHLDQASHDDAAPEREATVHVVLREGSEAAPSEQAEQGGQDDAPRAAVKRKRRSRQVPVEIDMDAARALVPKVEALLLSSDRPANAPRLAQLLGLVPAEAEQSGVDAAREEHACAMVAASVRELNGQLEATGRAFRVELLSGGYRVMTLPAHADVVGKLHKARTQSKLSKAAVEALAVIAYRQPVTRAELESIRGVSCGEVLRTLVERRLVTVKGRAEELGRPLIYGTTPQFLEHFGLTSIKDLPSAAEGLAG
jgi:segregation and condensation protein B